MSMIFRRCSADTPDWVVLIRLLLTSAFSNPEWADTGRTPSEELLAWLASFDAHSRSELRAVLSAEPLVSMSEEQLTEVVTTELADLYVDLGANPEWQGRSYRELLDYCRDWLTRLDEDATAGAHSSAPAALAAPLSTCPTSQTPPA